MTVLVADDHPSVIDGVKPWLEASNIKVLGSTQCLNDIEALYAELMPDVAVLDIMFGSGDGRTGIDVLASLVERHPSANVVMFSSFDQIHLIERAYELGARAFVTKAASPAVFVAAIKRAAESEIYIPDSVAQAIAQAKVTRKGAVNVREALKDKELEVFIAVAMGKTQQEIADEMGLHKRTITEAVNKIRKKLVVERVSSFVFLAIQQSLIDPNSIVV